MDNQWPVSILFLGKPWVYYDSHHYLFFLFFLNQNKIWSLLFLFLKTQPCAHPLIYFFPLEGLRFQFSCFVFDDSHNLSF